jgi:hypothetical protein
VAVVPVVNNTYLRTTRLPSRAADALVAFDRSGRELYCTFGGSPCSERLTRAGKPDVKLPRPRGSFRPPRGLKPRPTRLGRLLQRGAAAGATVSVYAPGIAIFDTVTVAPRISQLLRAAGAESSCVRARVEAGRWVADESGGAAATASRFRLDLHPHSEGAFVDGLPPPYDGCEIGGLYGHRWDDRYGTHTALEIPLTRRGRLFFADRGAARDLAYLVRSAAGQRARLAEDPSPILDAVARRHPGRLARLAADYARAPVGAVGFWIGRDRIVFSEVSTTRRRFVVVAKRGTLKLLSQNLGDLAFVF